MKKAKRVTRWEWGALASAEDRGGPCSTVRFSSSLTIFFCRYWLLFVWLLVPEAPGHKPLTATQGPGERCPSTTPHLPAGTNRRPGARLSIFATVTVFCDGSHGFADPLYTFRDRGPQRKTSHASAWIQPRMACLKVHASSCRACHN